MSLWFFPVGPTAALRASQMTKMSRFREIVASNLFPTAEMVISMSREFGVPLTYEDFENHHKPRQETGELARFR